MTNFTHWAIRTVAAAVLLLPLVRQDFAPRDGHEHRGLQKKRYRGPERWRRSGEGCSTHGVGNVRFGPEADVTLSCPMSATAAEAEKSPPVDLRPKHTGRASLLGRGALVCRRLAHAP